MLKELGRIAEAAESYGKALELNPEVAIAHHNRALCRLQLGDYAGGWEEYEWRKRCPTFDDPRYGLDRLWQGEPLKGRSLFLFPELFQGDVIQFSRFALAAEQAGAEVTLAAPPAMHALLSTLSPNIRLLEEGAVPGGLRRPVAAAQPALPDGDDAGDDSRRALARRRSGPRRAPGARRSGRAASARWVVVWQGSTAAYALPLARSFPLAALRDLGGLPGVRLISPQKVNGLEQLDSLRRPA